MAVVSKFLDGAIDRYEKLGLSKHKVSTGLIGLVAAAYIAHATYPHITRLINGGSSKCKSSSSDTSSTTTDDEEFDSDSDEFDANDSIAMNNAVDCSEHANNNNTMHGDGKLVPADDQHDNDETVRGSGDLSNDTRMMVAASSKRKKKHSKVIKQQIKQAEKLLAANKERKEAEGLEATVALQAQKKRIGLNVEFLFQLKRLIEIMIPKLWCRETTILGVHTMCLLSRTFLSFYVASVEGSIVKYIVRKDFRQFIIGLLKWFGIAIPATFINSMIRYLENKLALSFR